MTDPEVREASVAEVQLFTYGAFNLVAALLVAFLGSFLGLLSTGRARTARTRGRRNRWLIIAAFSIGGAAVWLMRFVALLGFDVPASPVRYDVPLTVVSLLFAVLTIGAGLLVVGHGRRSFGKSAVAGVLTGVGVLATHYTQMGAVHVQGSVQYRPQWVIASVLIAVAAATAILWFAVSVRGWWPTTTASAILAGALCGMHYAGMAAVQVRLDTTVGPAVEGIRPMLLIVPVTLVTAVTILGLALNALQALTEEEFTAGAGVRRRGVHAGASWSAAPVSGARRPAPRLRPASGYRG